MQSKDSLIEAFKYNDFANKKILGKISMLPDPSGCIRFFSHLINSQDKWMARILQHPDAQEMSWWDPIYSFEQLEVEWTMSLEPWLLFIHQSSEEVLDREVMFKGFDNEIWAATPRDIAIQLNFHSVHHRAQMQTIIRQQGLEPDFLDYIGTKYRRVGN